MDDSGSEDDRKSKKKTPAVKLEIAENGRPIIPDAVIDGSLAFDDLHPIVREYMTMNYS